MLQYSFQLNQGNNNLSLIGSTQRLTTRPTTEETVINKSNLQTKQDEETKIQSN